MNILSHTWSYIYEHAENMNITKKTKNLTATKTNTHKTNSQNPSRTSRHRNMMAIAAISIQTKMSHWEHKTTFDTDSYEIGVDNRCPVCISHDPTDFIGKLIDSERTIMGFGGTRTTNIKRGTLLW